MDYNTIRKLFEARREKIRAYLATGKTQEQAAIKFGVTRQRIQQIAKRKVNK